MVIIDSKVYRGQGQVELELPVGDHNYVIAEDGYNSIEGVARLNAASPRIITESLVRTSMPQSGGTTSLPPSQAASSSASQPSTAVTSAFQNRDVETITVKGVSFNMVRVEGNTFRMGSDDTDADYDEKPVHQVTLSTYSIGETEVTQELWETVMESNPSESKGAKRPVENVNWKDCQKFIQKLNQATGKKFRLPTEAEWEYAARGGLKSRNFKYAGSNSIDDVAWMWANSGDERLSGTYHFRKTLDNNCGTHNVKTKQSNELGLYDMSGNIKEWCQDRSRFGYSSKAQTNPTGPSKSGYGRVLRGGGFNDPVNHCRSSSRSYSPPSNRFNCFGLRLVL